MACFVSESSGCTLLVKTVLGQVEFEIYLMCFGLVYISASAEGCTISVDLPIIRNCCIEISMLMQAVIRYLHCLNVERCILVIEFFNVLL